MVVAVARRAGSAMLLLGGGALLGLLVAVRPVYGIAIALAGATAVMFLHIQRPAAFWMAALPALPILNWTVYDRLGTGAAVASLMTVTIVWAACLALHVSHRTRFAVSDAFVVGFVGLMIASQVAVGSRDGLRFLLGAAAPAAVGYFALRRAFSAPDARLDRMWWSFLVVTAGLALMGIFEGLTGHDLLSFTGGVLPVSGVDGVSRVSGPFPEDIEYALSLLVGLGIVINGWDGQPWETASVRRAAAAVSLLSLVAIYFTYFRTTWALALLMVFVWMRRNGSTGIAVGVVVTVISVAVLNGQLDRLKQSSIVQTRVLSADNVNTRLATNEKSVAIFKDHPVVGIGWFNFASDSRVVAVNGIVNVDTPHNAYLGVLAELGALGEVLFLGACAAVVWAVVRLRRTARAGSEEAAWLFRGLVWAPIVFLVASLDFQTLTLPFPCLLFFASGGIASAVATRAQTT